MRVRYLALVLLLTHPAAAAAEWHIKPFLGLTFGGNTTFVDVEKAVGKPNPVFGLTGVWLGNILGVGADLRLCAGIFSAREREPADQQPGHHPDRRRSGGAAEADGGIHASAVFRRWSRHDARPVHRPAGRIAGVQHAAGGGSGRRGDGIPERSRRHQLGGPPLPERRRGHARQYFRRRAAFILAREHGSGDSIRKMMRKKIPLHSGRCGWPPGRSFTRPRQASASSPWCATTR